jgi:voltage-gated potassium channel
VVLTAERNDLWGAAFQRHSVMLQCLLLTVALSAVAAVTIPETDTRYLVSLQVVLWLCLSIFIWELALQLWIRPRGQWREYLLSAKGLVDLLAVIPVPVAFLCGAPSESAWLLGSLWVLKLIRFVPGIALLRRVIAHEARPLASVLVIFLIILVFASVCLYLLEASAQPERFGSLPKSLWWAVTTLTTTGYGDSVPVTPIGRLIASFVMICGLGVFGLWTGILATGFAAEHRRHDFIRNWQLVTRVPLFSELDPTSAIEIARLLRRIDLAEGTVVVRRGKPGDCMYFIAEGEVEVRIEPRPVKLGPGQFFGEIAILDGSPRSATVVTTRPSRLLALGVPEFRSFTAVRPDIAELVDREAKKRLWQNSKQEATSEKSPDSRRVAP